MRTQRLGHDDRAVGLLVVLEDRDDPSRGRERAVQRGRDLVAALTLDPGVEPPGLEGRAVGGRRELAVATLGRHPRLTVELARRRPAEVTRRGVDDAVGHLDRGEHLLLEGEQALVLGHGILGTAVDEHLDLVELVHADDAAGVLAVGAGLAAVTRRLARVPQGPGGQVEHLVGVVARECDLGGAGQVEVVGLEAVHLVGVVVEEPGAGHDVALDQGRGDHRHETRRDGALHGQPQQAHLEAGAGPLEEVEPGPGDLGPARHVDGVQALGEREVVTRLEALCGEVPGGADGLEHDVVVLTAARHLGLDDVADGAQQGVELDLGLVGVGLQRLDLRRDLLGAGEQRLLLLTLGAGDVLAHRLLLGAQLLVCRERAAATLVSRADGVDDTLVLTPGALAGTDGVGVVAQQLDVDHPGSLSAPGPTPVPQFLAPRPHRRSRVAKSPCGPCPTRRFAYFRLGVLR